MNGKDEIKGILKLIDRCQCHLDMLFNEIENSKNNIVKSNYTLECITLLYNMKKDYKRRLRNHVN